MTRVVIIGGKLQGLEIAYLASKAGMESILIDKKDNVIAKDICSRFLCTDVLKKEKHFIDELKKADLIIPALENIKVLRVLEQLKIEYDLILAFDLKAYNISSSKLLSDKLIQENNIPSPSYYPYCSAPYIIKPSSESGSEGVRYIESEIELQSFINTIQNKDEWIIQEYLYGKSYSIEVIGMTGNYRTYEITEIIVDQNYDCKRVYAPCDISCEMKTQLKDIALKLANILNLKGIMDVEVINHNGTLKVLEIDARMPSQTPTVVYHSSGINYVEELRDIFINKSFSREEYKNKKNVSFEHLLIEKDKINILGEHIISNADPLKHKLCFCGADEVLTDYNTGYKIFRGTFINIADNKKDIDIKRINMFKQIMLLQEDELKIIDLGPSIL